MGSGIDDGRGPGRFRLAGAARGAAAGWPSGLRTNPAVGLAGGKTAKGAVLLAAVLLAAVLAMAVAAAPALAQVSGGNPPDYVLEKDGSVVIDGDGVTDCRSFASFIEDGSFESEGISAGARRVLEQCEEAGLLDSGGGTPGASAGASASPSAAASTPPGASAADGEDEGLPETGGPALPALLVVSSIVVMTGGLLVRKVAG